MTSRPTFATVDLEAFSRNVDAIRAMLPPGSRLIAVLKADAYGHGAIPLAKVCAKKNVAMIAVALLEEALELHRAAIDLPILVLAPLSEEQTALAAEHEIAVALVGPEGVEAATRVAAARRRPLRVHLKLDTGMGRMGLVADDLPRAAELISQAPFLQLEAIYSHYANASDPDDPFTLEQQRRFAAMLEQLKEGGVRAPLHHFANSAATVRRLVAHGDFVRVGVALFGAEPLDRGGARLEPVLRWSTAIARIKTVSPGSPVGYGLTWRAQRESRIATLPVGYADGYERLLSNKGDVLVQGRRAPVVGRISMDLVTIDVTDIPSASVGDEVVLLGRQGDEEITAEELAEKTLTISYEVFCRIGKRVPRVYRDG